MIKKISKIDVISLLIFFLLASYLTFPLIFNLTNFTTGYGDEILIAWNQNWNIYNYVYNFPNILHIFNTNIYFPYQNTLAYSDVYFTNSLIALIPVLILKSPIVANNINTIISLTLVGFFTFKLSKYLSKNNIISFLSGCLIIFSPAFLAWLLNLQVITIYFIPLAMLFLIKYLDSKKHKFFIGFLVALVLQTYNSFMPGFFIVFASFFICMFFCFKNKQNYKIIFTKINLSLILFSFLLIAIIAIPYFRVSTQFSYVRDIRDTIHFALQPEDFMVTNNFSRLSPVLSKLYFSDYSIGKHEVRPAFLGFVFTIISIISIIYILKNWKKQNYVMRGLFTAALLGLLLSFGPFLHINRLTIHKPFPIPLPYLVFYYLIPGFSGLRNSARFEIMYIIFILPVIAVFLKNLLKKIQKEKATIFIICLIIFTVLEFNSPMIFYPIPQIKDFPKVYAYLSSTPKSTVVAHMPIYNWNTPHSNNELLRQYYSTQNFRNMINGGSGFSPPPWQTLVNGLLANFPSNDSINTLKNLGVNLVVVHKSDYDILYKENVQTLNGKISSGSAVVDFLLSNIKVSFVKHLDNDYVFQINQF
jgi:hypothetical protein